MTSDTEVIIKTAKGMGSPRLSELVARLTNEARMKPDDAARSIYLLWKSGRIQLVEPAGPSGFAEYIRGPDSLWFWALVATVAVTIPVVFLSTAPPLLYLRYALGALFVLYLPGSMLIEALYSKAKDLEAIERVALSVGLSLALVPLVGLLLNFTPWGIRIVPVMVSLALLTVALATVSLYRKFMYHRLDAAQ